MAKRSRNVVVNAGRWSRSSKQSFSYASPPERYEDIHYSCWRCKTPSVFTAEEQKEAFEVRAGVHLAETNPLPAMLENPA